ncbi:MAG: hypothetical protein QG657_2752, partial [Acidobacteriota bacterium]|nr:hypothetical protein [Acidobacteriota bacterium]
ILKPHYTPVGANMQLFNGISLHMEHYVNPKNLYMLQYDIYVHRNDPLIH